MDPVYGYESVNVEAQSRSLSSLLSGTKRLISVRKSTLAFGRGTMTFIRPDNRAVLAYVRQYQRRGHPLRRQPVALGAGDRTRSLRIGRTAFRWKCSAARVSRAIGELPYMITLAPYGFYWFQLQEPDKSQPRRARAVPEFETLVVPLNSTWVSLARDPRRVRARRAAGPSGAHALVSRAIGQGDPADAGFGDSVLRHRRQPAVARVLRGRRSAASRTRYVLPMQIEWVRFDRERYNPRALAAVRQGAREGTLLDVATDQIFIALLAAQSARSR